MTNNILSLREVASLFGVTRYAVDHWIRSGKITAVWTSPKKRGIYLSEIDRFVIDHCLVVSE